MPNQVETVIFSDYISDGPGYAGRVEVILTGRKLELKTVQGEESYTGLLNTEFPPIAESRDPDNVHLRDIFDTLPQDDRDYLMNDLGMLDASRVKWVRFEDGSEGAVILWGECCIVSVMRHESTGRVYETLDLSVTEEDVRSVADDVLRLGAKYGFKPDGDSVRDAVEESANNLSIDLSEDQIAKACDIVIEEQNLETA